MVKTEQMPASSVYETQAWWATTQDKASNGSLNFPPKCEVMNPALTSGTTLSCITKNVLVPAFEDVEPLSFCIDAKKIEEMMSDKTWAILAPDLMGNICDWHEIRRIADKYQLTVILDSADNRGSNLNGVSKSSFSNMIITIFYGSHVINYISNRGALYLNETETLEKAKPRNSWGRSSSLFDEKSKKYRSDSMSNWTVSNMIEGLYLKYRITI